MGQKSGRVGLCDTDANPIHSALSSLGLSNFRLIFVNFVIKFKWSTVCKTNRVFLERIWCNYFHPKVDLLTNLKSNGVKNFGLFGFISFFMIFHLSEGPILQEFILTSKNQLSFLIYKSHFNLYKKSIVVLYLECPM